ncbi:MAG: T9SS type A sorting domain-containing protein, partial [Ignavibacteriae bacterium]|nr:T9SS type A sorting domain-containing protein [Ignavibacteriota bacterium]
PIQEMIITDRTIPDSEKQTVWIHARTHPSETPSSWHFDGIVQELLSGKEEINYYLERIKFHLIPFTNPDGVFYGRSRTNYDGIDAESNWDKSEVETTSEVKVLRARMKELNDEKPFSVFLNLHSQVSSYCTFWVHTPGTTSDRFYQQELFFAYLNISDNQYFEKSDLRFSTLKPVFPEGWLWNNYGSQVMALTYETPYDNYLKNSSNLWVTNENLFELGSRTIFSIVEYLQISHPRRYLMDNSIANISGNHTTSTTGLEFFGDDFIELDPNDNSTSATFTSEELPKGQYDVAGWWASNNDNSYETKIEITAGGITVEDTTTQKLNGGQWNYLRTIELNADGIISINLNSNSTGKVVADAFRLQYVGPITNVENEEIPNKFTLYQNYPNPFNPTTTIKYSIPVGDANFTSTKNTILKIYDILGKEVFTLVDEHKSSGTYEVVFDASNLASGTYIYRLQVGSYAETKKMLLIK